MLFLLDFIFRLASVFGLALVFQASCFNVDAFAKYYTQSKLERLMLSSFSYFAFGFIFYIAFLVFVLFTAMIFFFICMGAITDLSLIINFDGRDSYYSASVVQLVQKEMQIPDNAFSGWWLLVLFCFYWLSLAFLYGRRFCHFLIKPIQKFIWKMA